MSIVFPGQKTARPVYAPQWHAPAFMYQKVQKYTQYARGFPGYFYVFETRIQTRKAWGTRKIRKLIRECPAYTLLCQFSPKDTGQSKVKQSHKIDEVTTVASAQAPKSLQPGKCPFHYPAAGWIPPAFTDFFPPAADMLLKSVNIDFLADSWIIIPLVQTEVSNFSPQKPAAHFPRVFQGCSYQAAVMDIGACDRHSQRNTLTVHMEMNLTATSPSVRRVASKPLSRCFFVSASALAARCRP